jgi:hypothetical protein
MKNRHNLKYFTQLFGLLLVVPLLVAHDFGTPSEAYCAIMNSCERDDPDDPEDYRIDGGSEIELDIDIGNNFEFNYFGFNYISPASSVDGTIPAIVFTPNIHAEQEKLSFVINDPMDIPEKARVGELWLHGVKTSYGLKLVEEALPPSTMQVTFVFDRGLDFVPQVSQIGGSSFYVLAGDCYGSADIKVQGGAEIRLNGDVIFKEDEVFEDYFPPLTFSANPGDVLNIYLTKSDTDENNFSSVWLFNPSGAGMKLYHYGEAKSEVEAGKVFMNMNFVIP